MFLQSQGQLLAVVHECVQALKSAPGEQYQHDCRMHDTAADRVVAGHLNPPFSSYSSVENAVR